MTELDGKRRLKTISIRGWRGFERFL